MLPADDARSYTRLKSVAHYAVHQSVRGVLTEELHVADGVEAELERERHEGLVFTLYVRPWLRRKRIHALIGRRHSHSVLYLTKRG